MDRMDHDKQVMILRELMRQLDSKENIDAGIMYKNPTSVYCSPEVAEREWEVLFKNHPQLIGLSADLPEIGSFITTDDFGVPVLATRDGDGRFRAFLNACRHRGARVAAEPRGSRRRFICPFHNWTYGGDGKLLGIPQSDHFGAVDLACRGLLELPAEEKYGLLFVHPQPGGHLEVDEVLGELAPEIAQWKFGEDMVYQGESLMEKRLNWKLANDTFGETYHFAKLHKNTLGQVFYGDVLHYESFERNHRFVIATRGIDRMRALPEEKWNMLRGTSPLYFIFPNIQLAFGETSISLIKIYPHPDGPGRSVTRVGHYATRQALDITRTLGEDHERLNPDDLYNPGQSETPYDAPQAFSLAAQFEVFDSTIEQEDYLMGEHQQRAAENGTLDHVVFGRNEPALHHYHRNFREALGMPPLEIYKGD